ncbi:hypothetical protein GON09_004565 [Rhodococcus sp. B50]|nr:hypothetical protein [Rhodococcus sp. B50]
MSLYPVNPVRRTVATRSVRADVWGYPSGHESPQRTEVEVTTSKKKDDEVRKDPPGPVDHGRDGGMATRENAPDVVERSDEKDD